MIFVDLSLPSHIFSWRKVMRSAIASLTFVFLSSQSFAGVIIGDMEFDDNAFGDVVLSATPSGSGHFKEESSPPNVNNDLTLPEDFAILEAIVLGSDMTRWVSLRTSEARLTIGFTDLIPVDGPGDDIAIFEIGATSPITVIIGESTQVFTSVSHGEVNMVLIDLADFGVFETSAVTIGATNIFNDIAGIAAINFVPEPAAFGLAAFGAFGLAVFFWGRGGAWHKKQSNQA